jgi:UDP-glucose 6-dehydrogenase
VGVGWVGLVTAACFAELGHDVYARDIVESKVESLRGGEVPMHEPGLPELVARNTERLHFTTEMSDVADRAQLLFCCVDTPPTYSGDADLSRVEAVVAELGDAADGHALVMKSTVPVGTGRAIQRRRGELGYVSNPEFLKEGSAVDDFMKPDRVVVGAGDHSDGYADRVEALYEPLDAQIVRTDVASAEMIKLASNAFLATKISFINEIANVSEEVGADVIEVARGMGLDDRIGEKFLRAGIGWGGSCLHGSETVLVRRYGRTHLTRLDDLWRRLEDDLGQRGGLIEPDDLEVLAWAPELDAPRFLPAIAATRRDFEGELCQVRMKTGRRVRSTPDHPWLVSDGAGGEPAIKPASELTRADWLPLALGSELPGDADGMAALVPAVEAAGVEPHQVVVRARADQVIDLVGRPIAERREIFGAHPSAAARTGEVKRTGALRLDELFRAELSLRGTRMSTATNGQYLSSELELDPRFWRVVGLYLAEGHASVEPGRSGERHRICWSFHPTKEQHLVDEVAAFWLRHGVEARTFRLATTTQVSV